MKIEKIKDYIKEQTVNPKELEELFEFLSKKNTNFHRIIMLLNISVPIFLLAAFNKTKVKEMMKFLYEHNKNFIEEIKDEKI